MSFLRRGRSLQWGALAPPRPIEQLGVEGELGKGGVGAGPRDDREVERGVEGEIGEDYVCGDVGKRND